jgi:hypothetical protein
MAYKGENVLIRKKQGGSAIEIASGAELDFLAGSLFKFAGSDQRAALAVAASGVAAGYKIARGVITPTDGTDTVVTGLSTVVAAVAQLVATPILTHMWSAADIGDQAGAPAAGSINLVHRSPTSSSNLTPIDAATTFVDVAWVAIGT